ncbi:SRA stem-loop-interacting RNA-binding protein, mitochondrial, partial [Egretta garzetta]
AARGCRARGSGPWVRVTGCVCVSPAEELKEYFSQFGSVQRCQLPFDKDTGFHKRYCWIKFSTPQDVQNVFQKDSHILEGAKLTLKQQLGRRRSQRQNQSE